MIGAVSMRNRATGKECETPKIDVARMKDGKIIKFTEYYDTARVMATAQAGRPDEWRGLRASSRH